MTTLHYYLRTTTEIDKGVQENILLDCLGDVLRNNPALNGAKSGMAETGVGPIDAQADIAFLSLLKTKGIAPAGEDKIFQSEGDGKKPDGTYFEWKLSLLFTNN